MSVKRQTLPDLNIESIWLLGCQAWEQGDMSRAQSFFREVIEIDPTCADAYLGLHATQPSNVDYLLAMLNNAEQIGYLCSRYHKQLHSTYRPAGVASMNIENSDDVRRALALATQRSGYPAQAEALLAETRPGTMTSAVYARLAFESRDYRRCLGICQKIKDANPAIAGDIHLMLGCSLAAVGLPDPAVPILELALAEATETEAELHTRYHLAEALEAIGKNDEAQMHLQKIFALDSSFAGVAQRLELDDNSEDCLPSDEPDSVWEQLVSTYEHGPDADEWPMRG